VIATSNEGISTFKEIIKLKDQYEKNILGIGRQAPLAHKLLLFLFSKPVVKVKDVEKQLKIAYNTRDSLLNKFCKLGILKRNNWSIQKSSFYVLAVFGPVQKII
jgi:Fic family protein